MVMTIHKGANSYDIIASTVVVRPKTNDLSEKKLSRKDFVDQYEQSMDQCFLFVCLRNWLFRF